MAFGTAISWVYVKDQTQSPTFTYQSAAIQSTGASFVQQANGFGAQGSAYLSDIALGTTPASRSASQGSEVPSPYNERMKSMKARVLAGTSRRVGMAA